MTILIPIFSRPATTTGPQASPRITLSNLFGAVAGSALVTVDTNRTQALRAIAVASCFAALERALEVAKEAKEDPGAAVGGAVEADGKIKKIAEPVFNAVIEAQEDRSKAPSASDELSALAQAIGADPVLAAAAFAVLGKGNAANLKTTPQIDCCLYWVASVDPELLERCARAKREQLINLIPDQQTRLKRIEDRVAKLEQGLPPPPSPATSPATSPSPSPSPSPAPAPSPSPSPSPPGGAPATGTGKTPDPQSKGP